LHQGKIFRIQIADCAKPTRESFEYFWLCDTCSRTFKIALKDGAAITMPIYRQLTAGEVNQDTKAA
jgi:hypothetical protein